MTLMKSLLLGSAATLVVVSAASAADLPTKKGAPAVEYVKVCKINGVAGWVLPGSDTCFKISGTVYAEYSVGSIQDEYTYGDIGLLHKTAATSRDAMSRDIRSRAGACSSKNVEGSVEIS